MRRVVVVGAGLAGHRAAAGLRGAGYDGDITVIGDEVHLPYDRPPLSKQVLAGTSEAQSCSFASDDLDVTWQLGSPAVALDAERKLVTTGGGAVIPYDGLVLATGRRARAWPGRVPAAGMHVLRTLDDAAALGQAIRPGVRVVIVGAGFIGCEVAATLRGRGVDEVTLIDIAELPMPVLGAEVGRRARALHEEHGVRLRLATSVAAFQGGAHVTGVRLESGERLPADLVLLALGSAPSTAWLTDSGIELSGGSVVCDEFCFALGARDVVAAGDVAAYPYQGSTRPLTIEHWATARDLGEIAATNLVVPESARRAFAGVPSVWSDQYDVKIKTAGLVGLADDFVVIEEDASRHALVVEARRAGRLVGAVTFNRNRAMLGYQRELLNASSAVV